MRWRAPRLYERPPRPTLELSCQDTNIQASLGRSMSGGELQQLQGAEQVRGAPSPPSGATADRSESQAAAQRRLGAVRPCLPPASPSPPLTTPRRRLDPLRAEAAVRPPGRRTGGGAAEQRRTAGAAGGAVLPLPGRRPGAVRRGFGRAWLVRPLGLQALRWAGQPSSCHSL